MARLSGVVFWESQLSLQAEPPAQGCLLARPFGQGLLRAGVRSAPRGRGFPSAPESGASGQAPWATEECQEGPPGPRRTLAWALEAVVGEAGGPQQGWLWEGQGGASSALSCVPAATPTSAFAQHPRPSESPKLGTYRAPPDRQTGPPAQGQDAPYAEPGSGWRRPGRVTSASGGSCCPGLGSPFHHSRKWKCS